MSSNFVKRYNAIGWDWYLESYDWSSWVSQPVKDIIESLETENAKLRELAEKAWKAAEMLCQAWDGPCHADGVSIKPPCPLDERDELCVYGRIQRDLRELGVEKDNGELAAEANA